MPTLNIAGKTVQVGDEFLKLTPEQQDATVDEIAQSLGIGGAPKPQTGGNVPEFNPHVPGYDPATGEVKRDGGWWDRLGAAATAASDLPIIGPALQAGVKGIAAGAVAPFSDKTFGEIYDQMGKRTQEVQQNHPGYALAGNIVGSSVAMAPIANTAMGARAFGLTGPSLISRMGASGATSLGMGAADMAARGGDIGDITQAGLVSGVIGAAIPGVSAAGRGVAKAVTDRVAPMVRGALNPTGEAGRRVGTSIAIDRANPAGVLGADDFAAASRNSQPIMNADRGGETTRALARAAANQSPEARGVMERATSDRFNEQSSRITKLISRVTGGKTDDLMQVDAIRDAAAAANRPAYQLAESMPAAQNMWHEGFAQLMQAPAMQQAARQATTRGANRAAVEGFTPIRNPFAMGQDGRIGLAGNARPTLQFWNQVKRNLDGMIGKAQRSGDRTQAADLEALRRSLLQMADEAVPEYRAARQGAAAFFGAEDSVDAGRMFARSTRSLPEYKRGILAMKPAEREGFEIGFASELIDQAKSAPDRTNVVRRMFGSPEQREKMTMAFGQQRAREIEAFVRVENAMDMLRGTFGNSTTARQLIEAGVVGGGAWAFTGDFNTGIAASAITAGARYAGKRIEGTVMTKVAELLLSDDPKMIEEAVKLATMSPKYMAALDAITKTVGVGARAAVYAPAARQLSE